MQRTGLFFGVILSIAVASTACSRTAEERGEQQEAALDARPDGGDEVTVTGCLTSAPDRGAFVVTAARDALTSGALYAGDGETPTYTYELTGNVSDLHAHVGREVEVKGRLDDDRRDEVEVDEEEKTELPERQSGDDRVTPAIETDTEMDINVRRLEVNSVAETGRACAAGRQ